LLSQERANIKKNDSPTNPAYKGRVSLFQSVLNDICLFKRELGGHKNHFARTVRKNEAPPGLFLHNHQPESYFFTIFAHLN
jgi:hypothetical protein